MLWKRSCASIVALTLVFVVAVSGAQQAPPAIRVNLPDGPQVFEAFGQRYRLVPLKGLVQPMALAFLPNGEMLIAERAGRLRVVRNGLLDPTPIGGFPEANHVSLKGLLDIALHPRFTENRLVYFMYSKTMPGETAAATATLAVGRYDGEAALTNVRDLLVTDAYYEGSQNSRLLFAPDGKLFMAVGLPGRNGRRRIGRSDSAQDPGKHAGKVLRLNDDGSAPTDNPFVGRAGYRPEIYASGFRNVLGLAFHPTTGELWGTDNGPQGGDEINVIKPGLNYGWPVISLGRAYSGDVSYAPSKDPTAPGTRARPSCRSHVRRGWSSHFSFGRPPSAWPG